MKTLILIPTAEEAAPLRSRRPDLAVRITGVGMAAVAATPACCIVKERPDRLILAGIAGATDRSLAPGDAVAVERERVAGLPERYQTDYQPDWIPDGLRRVTACTVSASGVAEPAGQIENMEGASFVAVCRALGIACAEVRTISNYTGDPFAEWQITRATERLAEVLIEIENSEYKIKNQSL